MVTVRGALLALVALALPAAGCISRVYNCESSDQCVRGAEQGFCEADSLCSYSDGACVSGHRYGDNAGGLSGTCVGGAELDAMPDAPDGDASVVDAPVDAMSGDAHCGGPYEDCCPGDTCEGELWCVGYCTCIAQINTGYQDVCVYLTDGRITCWGRDDEGQLSVAPPGPADGTPVIVAGWFNTNGVAPGERHTCAFNSGGDVRCWGDNYDHQLGNGDGPDSLVPTAPTNVPANVHSLEAGESHTLANPQDGSVWAWGANWAGQGGQDPATVGMELGAATQIPGLTGVVAVAAGGNHSCALTDMNTVRCWGANYSDQLGSPGAPDTPIPQAAIPMPFMPAEMIYDLEAGYEHTCARTADGSLACWGAGGFGQLGVGTEDDSGMARSPLISGLPIDSVDELAVGGNHTCIVNWSHELWCWGDNTYGQCGRPASPTPIDVPTQVPGVTDAWDVWAGNDFTCYIHGRDVLECFGRNQFGQLGVPPATPMSSTPVTPAFTCP